MTFQYSIRIASLLLLVLLLLILATGKRFDSLLLSLDFSNLSITILGDDIDRVAESPLPAPRLYKYELEVLDSHSLV